MKKNLPLCLLLLLGAASAHAADNDAYPIKLDRPSKKGAAYTLHALHQDAAHSVLRFRDGTAREQNTTDRVELTARVDVTDVDKFGREQAFTLTVQSLTDTNQKNLLPPATVITVQRTAEGATFSRKDGMPLDPAAQKALSSLYRELPVDNVTDDEAQGAKDPKKVGDTWPINPEANARDAALQHVQVDPASITGAVKLEKVDTVNGIKTLQISSVMDVADQKPPTANGITVDKSSLHMEATFILPADPALPRLSTDVTEELHLQLSNAASPGKMEVTERINEKREYTPIPENK